LGGLATTQLQALLSRFASADLQSALHILRIGGWVTVQGAGAGNPGGGAGVSSGLDSAWDAFAAPAEAEH